MRRTLLVVAVVASLGAAGRARADVWDVQNDNDNTVLTDNELVAGSDQIHDLGALPGPVADQDWFVMGQMARSSYEILVDGTSGDIGTTLNLARIQSDGITVLQNSLAVAAVGLGYSRTLSWQSVGDVSDEFIRILSGSCTTNCGPDDTYRIRAFETTLAAPRFNNAGGQATVCITQNVGDRPISYRMHLWNPAGVGLGSVVDIVNPKAASIINLATVGGGSFNGTSGTLTISHDGRLGQVAGKCVALDPATGFSFDTPYTTSAAN